MAKQQKIERVSPDELAGTLVEVAAQNALAATIPTNDPDRIQRVREQLVSNEESSQRASKPTEIRCTACGAEFVTQAAADLHDASFHPEVPKDFVPPQPAVAPTPVKVVDDKQAKPKKSGQAKIAKKDQTPPDAGA